MPSKDEENEIEIKELQQESQISKEIAHEYKIKYFRLQKKFLIFLVTIAIFVTIGFTIHLENFSNSAENTSATNKLKSQFLIQNLKGDVVDTWISWRILENEVFHIHVMSSPHTSEERLNAIHEVIMSTEKIMIDDSLLHKGPPGTSSPYYFGWNGALNSITAQTEFPIPKNLHYDITDKGEGDIVIHLTNLSNSDGYSGYTKAIIDQEHHQILKSIITIYDIESLSIEQLKTILRHELGHGLGLAHSTAPEDLMHPTIFTEYPYISQCNVDAIKFLYDGGQESKVICKN